MDPAMTTTQIIKPKRIAYYLRYCQNVHYFASIKPFLDYFISCGIHQNHVVVRRLAHGYQEIADYRGYTHLFTDDCDLVSYDLILTPTFLRDDEEGAQHLAVQIFHGMSDKPFTYQRNFSQYLLCLCAGQRQLDRLHSYECNHRMPATMVGYPKFDRIPANPPLYKNEKKAVIYCPTWRKGNMSSIELFLSNVDIIHVLAERYNLIVKPHPNIFNPEREFYESRIVAQLEQLPNIRLIRSGNVMGWFSQADLFVGDISASGYEWLYFNRPMVFLNPQPGVLKPSQDSNAWTYLWQCGPVCDNVRELPTLIANELNSDSYSDVRETVLHYSIFNPRGGTATQLAVAHILALLSSS